MSFRTTLLLGTAFLAGVAIGPASDLIAKHLVRGLGINAAYAQVTDRANTYRLLTLFGDVFERVRSEYVDPVSDKELMENALNGMLTGLDPHSAYMTADEFREMQVDTNGKFAGIGIEVVPENGFLKVISRMDDTPASKAGIKAGDIITRLNGKSVQGLSLVNMIDEMRGPSNTKVTLTIAREGVDHPLEISMRREGYPHPGGKAADGAGQHRLCAAHRVLRAGGCRAKTSRPITQAAGRWQAEGTRSRPAQ